MQGLCPGGRYGAARQRASFGGSTDDSAREGFLFWNGAKLYGVKRRNFKTSFVDQRHFFDSAAEYPNPHIVNLIADPKEREPVEYPHLHTWVIAHIARLIEDFQESVSREPVIPPGAPVDFVPTRSAG